MLALSLARRHPEQIARGLARRGWPPERVAACLAALADAPDDAALTALVSELPNLPRLGLVDAPRGARLAGPRFTLLRGWGARLERALLAFMLDLHTTQHGYTEIAPPLVASAQTLNATGHLPHFAEEMYALQLETPAADRNVRPTTLYGRDSSRPGSGRQDCPPCDLPRSVADGEQGSRTTAGGEGGRTLWLNPTAEVPLVALHAGELLAEAHLPLAYVAGMASFRREAGSAGRATRGLLRLHQFQKVELVQVTTPEGAPAAYEAMTEHAAAVLAALELPYRIVELPAPDLSFAAERGRDLEIWFPGMGAWIEVSSISLCGTFQARRAAIRYAPRRGGKPRYVQTLNASGLAVGRTLAALIEHGQTAAGAISIPPALRPYVGGVATAPPPAPPHL
jgi:seryl-tRNA synthetase